MKRHLLLLMAVLFISDAYAQITSDKAVLDNKTITNNFKNTDLTKVFSIWSANYKIDIDYDSKDAHGITIYDRLKDTPIDEAFEKVLSEGVTKVTKSFVFSGLLVF